MAEPVEGFVKNAAAGSLPEVKKYIASGCDPNAGDRNGTTGVIAAAKAGHINVVEFLLQNGAEVDREDAKFEATPLVWAALNGRTDVVKLLIEKGANTEAREKENGMAALHGAAVNGHTHTLKVILEYGIEVNCKDRDARTPLMWAVSAGQIETIQALLDVGADLETRELTQGMTAFIAAAASNQPDAMTVLLESGADIEARTFDGKTALMVAAFIGHFEVVKLLVASGADVKARDKKGNDALAYSMLSKDGSYSKQDIQELLRSSTASGSRK